MKKKMHIVVMLVTPELALEWLKRNLQNRDLSHTNVLKYANDIVNGRWFLTHQGVAFDTDGALRDGQHRLFAIWITKKAVEMAVAFDVPKEAFIAVDNGKNRTVTDEQAYSGNPLPKEYVPTLRGMIFGEGRRGKLSSNAAWKELIVQYDDAVRFTLACFVNDKSIVGLKTGAIMGAFGRAYYSQPHAKLQTWARIWMTGEPQGGAADITVIRLRNWRLSSPESRFGEVYRKTERAIQAFVNGEALTKFYEPTEELFPIPSVSEETKHITDARAQIKQLQEIIAASNAAPNAHSFSNVTMQTVT